MCDSTIVRHEIVRRILRCHSALHCESIDLNIVLSSKPDFRIAEIATLCNQNLCFHDVNVGDLFGDGVLDLNPRIHFNEVVFLSVHVYEEFNGSRTRIIDLTTNL